MFQCLITITVKNLGEGIQVLQQLNNWRCFFIKNTYFMNFQGSMAWGGRFMGASKE